MVPEESPTPKSAEGYTSAIALIFKKGAGRDPRGDQTVTRRRSEEQREGLAELLNASRARSIRS